MTPSSSPSYVKKVAPQTYLLEDQEQSFTNNNIKKEINQQLDELNLISFVKSTLHN